MDLDYELEQKRNRVLKRLSLDFVNTRLVDKADMRMAIYQMIEMEVWDMKVEGKYHYGSFMLTSFNQKMMKEKFKLYLKRVDKYFQKNNFYKLRVRELLKKVYRFF